MARQAGIFRNQSFHIKAPSAKKVMLVGDFTNWQQQAIPMKRGNDGMWRTTLGLGPGTHNYLFIVDGAWCDDPECPVRVPNPFGGENMIRVVS